MIHQEIIEMAEQAIKENPGSTMIPGKTFSDHFTIEGNDIIFWFNDDTKSTGIIKRPLIRE